MNDTALRTAYEKLRSDIGRMGPMIVAYSGGVDSAFLLKVAHDALGEDVLAVTAVSPSLPGSERRQAALLASRIGARHIEIETLEMLDPRYVANPADRCYFCKSELFGRLKALASELGIRTIAYGANLDDTGDFRPGMRAAEEAGAKAPLLEAGLTKAQIRALSRMVGLPTWDAPSQPCLSSRIPHGVEVTPQRLQAVERAEESLRALGFRQLRVRYHGEVARIELGEDEISRLAEPELRRRVVEGVRGAGFRHVALDLGGYRQGSLNLIESG